MSLKFKFKQGQINQRPCPNSTEIKFLEICYKRFFDLFIILNQKDFFGLDPSVRLCRFKEIFSAYDELKKYRPIKSHISYLASKSKKKTNKDKVENEVEQLFSFTRHILSHFPLFDSWDEIYINYNIVNWAEPGQFIDTFLTGHKGKKDCVFQYVDFLNPIEKPPIKLQISFPRYLIGRDIFLKDFISEKTVVEFSKNYMLERIISQIENVSEVRDYLRKVIYDI